MSKLRSIAKLRALYDTPLGPFRIFQKFAAQGAPIVSLTPVGNGEKLIEESVGSEIWSWPKKDPVYSSIQLFRDDKLEWHLLLLQLAGLKHEHLLVINKRATYAKVVTKTLLPNKCLLEGDNTTGEISA